MSTFLYTFLDKQDLEKEITGGNGNLIEDKRPLQSVSRCLNAMNYRPAISSNGTFLLIVHNQIYECTFVKILYICRDYFRKQQDITSDWYKKMCAEESEEEIEFLLEIYHATHSRKKEDGMLKYTSYLVKCQDDDLNESSYSNHTSDPYDYPEYLLY